MNCYYHPKTPAVGICKQCSRGLCEHCANDEGYGVACRDKHEEEVRAVGELIKTNLKTIHDAPSNMWLAPVLFLVMGIVFITNGILNSHSRADYFLLAFGGVFVVYGILTAWRAYRIFGLKNNK